MLRYKDTDHTIYRYKYLPFDEGSLKVITEGTLKFTCPLEFNDPFDCWPSYDPASIDNIIKLRPDLIKAAGKSEGLSPAKRLQRYGVYKANIRRSVESGEFVRALISGLGVFCVSRDPANILMWSHYAQHHRGFVVGFEISASTPNRYLDLMTPLPITYQEKRPMLSWANGCDIEGYFLTKSEHWSYEKEERMLTNKMGPGIYTYSREHFLCSVIAGGRMRREDLMTLKQATEQAALTLGKQIGFHEARLADDAYEIVIS